MGEQREPSQLWKSGLLATESTNFRVMVQAAAGQVGRPYTDSLLRAVAASTELLNMVVIPDGEGVDSAVASVAASDLGWALDEVILGAVRAYEPRENG